MLQKAGGLFQLLAEVDFGTTYGLKSLWYKTRTANPADAGQFRLARADVINWRNQGGTGNLSLSVNASDNLLFNGTPVVNGVSVLDTDSIDLTLAASVLSADLILSVATATAGYSIAQSSIELDGLKVQMNYATTLVDGSLSSADWNTFNNKQPALTIGNLTGTNISVSGGTGAVIGSGAVVSIPQSVATSATPTFAGMTLTAFSGVVKASAGILSASALVNADVSGSAAIAYSKLALSSSIVNADINSSAAIAYSKLALTNSIVNADVNSSAAIAYSKLNLALSILNADVSASAAIAFSKLASLTSAHILVGSAGNVATDVAVSGDVTISNAGVTAIGSNKVANSQLAQMAANSIKGNNTGSTANAADLTATQVRALITTGPTVQKFTSSSGTYTTPAGVAWIRVTMVGGGGGGAGSGLDSGAGGAGGNGGATTFGTTLLSAGGGTGGPAQSAGGAGGTSSLGSGPIGLAVTGSSGSACLRVTLGTIVLPGGSGGASALGGAGSGGLISAGGAGVTNTGGGGGGGGGFVNAGAQSTGSGGGSGGFVCAIIVAPAASYSYAVGTTGSAGTNGTSGSLGGVGGSGVIVVEEFYI